MPNSAPNEQVIKNFKSLCIDDSDMICRAKRHKSKTPIRRELDTYGLDFIPMDTGDSKADLVSFLPRRNVNDVNSAANFRRCPEQFAIRRELHVARTLADQSVVCQRLGF